MKYLKSVIEAGWDISDMAKDDRINMVINEVKNLPITEVLASYGVKPEKISYNRVFALCPFHLDEHIGSFSIDTIRNVCFCYSCQKGGDSIKAMSLVWNKPYIDTALQIAADNGIIPNEEFNKLSGSTYSDEYLDRCAKRLEYEKMLSHKRQDDDTLQMWTEIYEALRDYFGLSKEDYKYLKNERHLTDDRIRADYFSFCVDSSKEASRIIFHLKKILPQYSDKLSEIPGFFETKEKNRYIISMLMTNSLGILLRNAKGQVVAIQQRDKNPNSNTRYSFYSWKVAGKIPDIRGGGTVGTPIDVRFPKTVNKLKVAIVEGRFKSEMLAYNGFISLSVQGVNNFRGIEQDILDIEERIGKEVNTICVFYDADLLRNGNVYAAGVKLAQYLNERLPNIAIRFVIWPPELGKGIDDLIIAGNKRSAQSFSSEFFIETYKRTYEASIAKTGIDLRNIAKITKDERRKFFDVFEDFNRAEFEF